MKSSWKYLENVKLTKNPLSVEAVVPFAHEAPLQLKRGDQDLIVPFAPGTQSPPTWNQLSKVICTCSLLS